MGSRVAQTLLFGSRQEKIILKIDSAVIPATLAHKAAGFVGAWYLRFAKFSSSGLAWDHPSALQIRRSKTPCVYAFWHNRQVYLAVEHRNERIAVMVSRSKDGEYIAQVMQRLGLEPVRGSSSKGGDQALRTMVSLLNDGRQVGFTPDGPRGPLHTVHGGVALAAQSTSLPIVPTTYFTTRRVEFRSWDRFVLPLPFGTVLVAHGKPFTLPAEVGIDDAKKRIHDALQDNERDAAAAFERCPSWGSEFFAGVLFCVYDVMVVLLAPLLAVISATVFGWKRGARFLGERFSAPPASAPAGSPIWFHAASVGEWQALKPLLREMKALCPDGPLSTVITVSTPEARDVVTKEAPDALVRMVPVDVRWLVSSWFRRLQPRALVIVETEIWPNLIREAARRHVPVFVVNGRLSERSYGRWKYATPLIRHLLFKVTHVFARGADDAAHFANLGVPGPRVSSEGNTKVDNVDVSTGSPLLVSDVPVLIGGSTWPGEEQFLIDLLKERAGAVRGILAPRKLERIDEIRGLLEKAGLSFDLYSAVKNGAPWKASVLLVDTIGDLKKLYSSAQVAFVGGSVFLHGGQNPLEPAAAGVPVVFGPSMSNFRGEAQNLISEGAALQGHNAQQVRAHLIALLSSPEQRSERGNAAAKAIAAQKGASHRIARRLCDLLSKT